MEAGYQTILDKNYYDLQSGEDAPNKMLLNHESNLDSCILKFKTPNGNYPFFQKLKYFKYVIDIQDFLDWYSKLDEATKRKITSYNSQKLIHFIGQLYLIEIQEKKKPICRNYCEQEQQDLYCINSKEENSKLYDGFYSDIEGKESDENDIKTTSENTEEQNLNENKIYEKDVSKYTKICSLKEAADTLIFDVDSKKLNGYLNFFSKGDSKVKPINPELIDNEWYIALPSWENLQSFLQIIVCTLILMHYEYYLLTDKIYEMQFFNKLRKFFEQNDSKLNELLGSKVDVTNDIFSQHNSIFLAEECSSIFIEKYSDEEFHPDKNEFYLFNFKALEELKNDLSEFKTNEEKLKILFEKISFFKLENLKDAKHFIYFEFRNFLLKYNDPEQKIDVFYRNIIYNTEKLKPIKEKYLKFTKKLLKKIFFNNERIVQFGSYFTGLATELSDIDILIFYNDGRTEVQYGNYLLSYLDYLQKEKIIKNFEYKYYFKNLNAPPVIKITYDVSEEIENYLNEINFSLKYLDSKKDDLKKIKFDISFTNNLQRVLNTLKLGEIIKTSLIHYKQLKPVILYLKIYFITEETYSTYKGGINSLSLYSFPRNILVEYDKNKLPINSFSKKTILFKVSEKFGHYNFLYGIGKDGNDYRLNYKEFKARLFVIQNPADNKSKNIAFGCFNTEEIIRKFYLLFKRIKEEKDIFLPLQKPL